MTGVSELCIVSAIHLSEMASALSACLQTRRPHMEASIVDLRYKMKDVLRAIDRNEKVDILYHGRRKAVLVPASDGKAEVKHVHEHPFFGMRQDEEEPVEQVMDRLRGGRYRDL